MLAFILALSCGQPADPGSTGGPDSGSPVDDAWFDEAVLEPAFTNGNALWAGVALLDYDNDGWTDIFLTNGRNLRDGLYRNNGDGSFTDVALEAGMTNVDEHGAVVAGDIDNDGDTDMVVLTECTTNTYAQQNADKHIYRNNGDGTFGYEPVTYNGNGDVLGFCSHSLELFDLNADGWLDLVMANGSDPDVTVPWIFHKEGEGGTSFVFYNDGTGTFYDSDPLPDETTTFVATSFDLNADGWVDLLLGQGGREIQIWLGSDRGLVPAQERQDVGWGLWMGLATADFDGDGDFDIYATNQGLSTMINGYDNTAGVEVDEGAWINYYASLFRNDDGFLTPVTPDEWPVQADHMLAGDIFDGYGGLYPDMMHPEGLERYPWGWGAVAADIDADGWMDVASTNNNCSAPMDIIWDEAHGAGPGALLLNDQGRGFIDVTWEAGVQNVDEQGRYQDGRGVATGDLNNDGYADLVFANRTYNPTQSDPLAQQVGYPHVWLSRERDHNWLKIKLQGTVSNRDAIGASVRITRDDGDFVYPYRAGGSTNSSSELMLVVGLGGDDRVDIQVTFPSGQVVQQADVDANQLVTIVETE